MSAVVYHMPPQSASRFTSAQSSRLPHSAASGALANAFYRKPVQRTQNEVDPPWELCPDTDDYDARHVCATYPWATEALVFADGTACWTKNSETFPPGTLFWRCIVAQPICEQDRHTEYDPGSASKQTKENMEARTNKNQNKCDSSM